jgi:hypothetical protein
MSQWLFVPRLLQMFSQGSFFRNTFFYLMRLGAVLCALGGLIVFCGLWTVVSNLSPVEIAGLVLFQLFLVVAVYAAFHIYWLRANDIRLLPEAKFIMLPIVSILLRTAGEAFATVGSILSLGLCIFYWFTGAAAATVLSRSMAISPFSPLMDVTANPFLGGIVLLLCGLIYSFLVLAFFYVLAEMVLVLAQIAINTGIMASAVTNRGSAVPVAVSSHLPSNDTVKVCPHCGAATSDGLAFCDQCGHALGGD